MLFGMRMEVAIMSIDLSKQCKTREWVGIVKASLVETNRTLHFSTIQFPWNNEIVPSGM